MGCRWPVHCNETIGGPLQSMVAVTSPTLRIFCEAEDSAVGFNPLKLTAGRGQLGCGGRGCVFEEKVVRKSPGRTAWKVN